VFKNNRVKRFTSYQHLNEWVMTMQWMLCQMESTFLHNANKLSDYKTATCSSHVYKVKRAYLHSRKIWPVIPATTTVPEHWTCQLRQGPRHYTQWSTECDGSCKQLADVVQQFAVRDESPPWSRHLDWVAPRRVSCNHPRQHHVLSPCMVWSLLSIRPCKTGLISKPLHAPGFLWQYCTHHIKCF